MTNTYSKIDQIKLRNDDLDVFVRVVDSHSFSEAARVLQVSPKSVSKQISRLEQALGVTLFDRNTRHLRITDEGRDIVERARVALSLLRELEEFTSCQNDVLTGHIRLTVPAPFGRKYVAAAIADFHREHPLVSFDLCLSDQVQDLYSGNFDLAIRIGELADSQLVARKIATNRRILVASPEFVAQYGMPTEVAALAHFKCLVFAYPGLLQTNWSLRNGLEERSVRVNAVLSSDNGEVLDTWCLAGLGIGLRETWDVHEDVRKGQLLRVLPDWEERPSAISLIRARRDLTPKRLTVFGDFLIARWQEVPWDK